MACQQKHLEQMTSVNSLPEPMCSKPCFSLCFDYCSVVLVVIFASYACNKNHWTSPVEKASNIIKRTTGYSINNLTTIALGVTFCLVCLCYGLKGTCTGTLRSLMYFFFFFFWYLAQQPTKMWKLARMEFFFFFYLIVFV